MAHQEVHEHKHKTHTWGYNSNNGPHSWSSANVCPQAGGAFQSPINIDSRAARFDPNLSANLLWSGTQLGPSKLINTGHGFKIEMDNNITLSGGPLKDDFDFHQFHLHWGSGDGWGSEHTLDGRAFPAELHIVHVNHKYGVLKEAIEHKDGLAVVGFFVQLGAPNTELGMVINSLSKVRFADDELDGLPPVPFTKLLSTFEPASLHKNDYYTYAGSLTTPPCKECVTWVVMAKPITISAEQLEMMRQIYMSHHGEEPVRCVDNFRPPVPLGTNRVLRTTILH